MKGRMDCQSFREGCCGCCVNMRWRPERVWAFVAANTEAAWRIFPNSGRPRYRDLTWFVSTSRAAAWLTTSS